MINGPQRGDEVNASLWFNPAHLTEKDDAKHGVRMALNHLAETRYLVLGPVKWETLSPDDPRLPKPPKGAVQGIKCLLGTARVTAVLDRPKPRRFVDDLDRKDLERFRKVTRAQHRKVFPDDPELTDAECDDWIERYGPDAGANVVRDAVNRGLLN